MPTAEEASLTLLDPPKSPPVTGGKGGKPPPSVASKEQELERVTEGDGEAAEGDDVVPNEAAFHEDDPNQWYRWKQWSVSCYIRPPQTSKGRSASSSGASEQMPTAVVSKGEIQQLHLNIETCAVQPDIVLQTDLPMVGIYFCKSIYFCIRYVLDM